MTAFLLTWKEAGWPHVHIVRMAAMCETQGYVDEPWRLAAHTLAKPGDRTWVLRQGRGSRGIFGAGHITGAVALGDAGNGKTQMMAPVRFEAFVDPLQKFLIGADAVTGILRPNQIAAGASGYPIDDEQSAALEELLAAGPIIEPGGTGDWTQAETKAIVADYFAMLGDELAGRPYSKTRHRNSLRREVHRSPGSIERKHQNISAILQELGLPWINGYKPLGNFQDALVDTVEARVRGALDQLDNYLPVAAPLQINPSSVFVLPPAPSNASKGHSIARVIGKYDPATRDNANRALGKAGEDFAFRLERSRLENLGRNDLAEKVAWVADQIGDGFGYDIESFADDGSPTFIEVKTTKGPITTPFFVSENERRVAEQKGPAFRIYRIFSFGTDPKVYSLSGPLENALALEPVTYRARVNA